MGPLEHLYGWYKTSQGTPALQDNEKCVTESKDNEYKYVSEIRPDLELIHTNMI